MPRRTRPINLTQALFAENPVLSVSELTADIKAALEADFHNLYVQGEISNFKRYPSGHWYFTLKDANAQVSAVYFKNWNRLLRFDPENGLEVRVRGRLSVWEKSGNYQLNVESMEPVGVGAFGGGCPSHEHAGSFARRRPAAKPKERARRVQIAP
jgi:exodeoxyribonuclease VII large subunit